MTITALDADWSADIDDSGTKLNDDGEDWSGESSGVVYRTAIKFDITSIPATDTINQIDLQVSVVTANSGSFYIGPYNGNGQADVETDAGATAYTRCDVSSDNYGSSSPFSATGSATITDLGTAANSDLEAARDAGTIFTLVIQRVTESGGFAGFEEYSQTDPPTITIDHSAGGGSSSSDVNYHGTNRGVGRGVLRGIG